MAVEEEEITLADLIAIIWQRKWTVATVTLLFVFGYRRAGDMAAQTGL
jgi:uncharacterized protein involved in exopolysaccharide biosynthesis